MMNKVQILLVLCVLNFATLIDYKLFNVLIKTNRNNIMAWKENNNNVTKKKKKKLYTHKNKHAQLHIKNPIKYLFKTIK